MEYDVADAMAAMIVAPENTDDAKLKDILSMSSDIPADRLDFALGELKQSLPQLRMMSSLNAMINGIDLTAREVRTMLAGAKWVDDDKGESTMSIRAVDGDGNEVVSATIRHRITKPCGE